MRYKAKDIAKELGVSPTTISLVINNKPGVGDEKRQEILRKISELGCEYLLKESMGSKGTIGFVIYKCGGGIIDEYPFFYYLTESIAQTIEKNQYQMTSIFLDKNKSLNERLSILENCGCEGLIVYAVEMFEEDVEIFENLNIPCVYLDNPFPKLAVDAVTIDNYLGIYQAIDYLYHKGHREIGYIQSKHSIICFQERWNAYRSYIDEKGLLYKPEYTMKVGYSEKETERDILEYLENAENLPTAFVADNDLLACRAVRVMKKKGIRIPEEVSIIGFDNRPICYFSEPKISTIQISRDEMGGVVADMLMKKITAKEDSAKHSYTAKYRVGTQLVINESVRDI